MCACQCSSDASVRWPVTQWLACSTLPSNQKTGWGVGSGPVISLKSLLFPSRVVACHMRMSLGRVFVCRVMVPPSTPCKVGQHIEATPSWTTCKTYLSDAPGYLRKRRVLRGRKHRKKRELEKRAACVALLLHGWLTSSMVV